MKRIARWLASQRNSTRLSFILQICCRVLFSLLSLLWTPLLLSSMGRSLNGLFLNFQKMASLGVVGDLGMGGLVNIQTSRLLGQQKEGELRSFLAAARGVFLIVALLAGAIFLGISPQLFNALRFGSEPAVGSLPMLSLVGAATIMLVIFNGYINNLNYGCGNILWPILPTFVILQFSFLCHWLLARWHAPLWQQYLPYVAGAALIHALGWSLVRLSHPAIATVKPLRFSRGQFAQLGAKSFWVYLYSVAGGIYTATDGFLISAGFGPEWVPLYQYNYKLYELALFVVQSASLASLPKITQWIVSTETATRERGIRESLRLNKFQTFLGCCAVFICLNLNDWFMRVWLGKDFQAPLSWQIAFAANLGITAAGMMGSDLVARCSERGIRFGGLTVLASASLNLVLAFVAMKRGSILGIAAATAVAMTAQSLLLCWFSSRQLGISWWRLSLRNWILALTFAGLAVLIKIWIPPANGLSIACLLAVSVFVVWLAAWLTGISLEDLRNEKQILQSMFSRTKGSLPDSANGS